MGTPTLQKVLSIITVLLLAAGVFVHGQTPEPVWKAPAVRTNKTPLAPKPFGGHNIFKGQAEAWLADALDKLEGGTSPPLDDEWVTKYVSQIGNHLVSNSVNPKKQYEFIVTNCSMSDAMTAGGGRIYITLGMLEEVESEDELAGMLAHEIAHDAFAHTGKTISRQMFWMTGTTQLKTRDEVDIALARLLADYSSQPLASSGEKILGFSRFDELEADRAAFYNTYRAGYNPLGLFSVLQRMALERQEEMGRSQYRRHEFSMFFFGSHPPTSQRLMALSWESKFVKMPVNGWHFESPAFDAMKLRIQAISGN